MNLYFVLGKLNNLNSFAYLITFKNNVLQCQNVSEENGPVKNNQLDT